MIKYFFFDVADTLIHKPRLYSAIGGALLKAGYHLPPAEIRRAHRILTQTIIFPSRTSRDFYDYFNQELLISLGIQPQPQLTAMIYQACRQLAWEPYRDTDALGYLSRPLGIISNWDATLRTKIKQYFAPLTFSPLVFSQEAGYRKPKPEIFSLACRQAKCRPEEAVYVGNSLKLDILPAAAAGLATVLIDRESDYPYYRGKKIKNLQQLRDY